MIGIGARAMWPPGEKNGPGAAATASRASDYFHTEIIGQAPRLCKPVLLGLIVASLVSKFACDLPGKVDHSMIIEEPLELSWRDIERFGDLLGDCWLSLWLADCPRILVEDEALAEWIYDKLRAEGVLKRLPEIRVRSMADAA